MELKILNIITGLLMEVTCRGDNKNCYLDYPIEKLKGWYGDTYTSTGVADEEANQPCEKRMILNIEKNG